MGKVVSHMTISLDGFIADPQDGVAELSGWYEAGTVTVPSAGERWSFTVDERSAQLLRDAPAATGRPGVRTAPVRPHQGLLRSEQRLDRCDSHQVLHGIGELPVERDQSVGLELGQSDVLSVKRVRPPELVGDLPCGVLKEVVFVHPDPHPLRVEEASLGILLGHLTTVYCLVEE